MTEINSNYFYRDSLINRPFNWQKLRKFGSSKAVKSSYYWIFLIPLIAKIAHQLHPVALNLLGIQQAVKFSLPFSWYFLYFSALSFAFASLLYDIFCPKVISSFKDFREFLDSGYEGLFLADEFEKNVSFDILHNSPLYWIVIAEWKKTGCDKKDYGDIFHEMRDCLWEIKRENLDSIFYIFTEVVNYSHTKIMKMTGFFLLSWFFPFICSSPSKYQFGIN